MTRKTPAPDTIPVTFIPSPGVPRPTVQSKNVQSQNAPSPEQGPQPLSTKAARPQIATPSGGKIQFRSQTGYFQRLRSTLNALLILLFLLIPFIDWNGRQAILFDIASQQFYLFGLSFWPQDFTVLAWIFIAAAFGLFFVTQFWGRIWCGFLCPQTAWTFMFAWVEEKIEGSRNQRIALDRAPMSPAKAGKRAAKHSLWLLMSLITGCGFIAYFIPAKTLYPEIFSLSSGFWETAWVYFFALCTYLNAGWMREQMCLHCCPYSRFQSVMFDEHTLTVTYDGARGESRGPRKRKADTGLGDCVDCNLCVEVCPTGIDIRNGLQYECINCGACVDACNQTMDHFGYRPNLISFTSEAALVGNTEPVWQRRRFLGYGVALGLILITLGIDLSRRDAITLNVLRDRQTLAREVANEQVENTYLLKIRNKTQQERIYQISVSSELPYDISRQQVRIGAGEQLEVPLTLRVAKQQLTLPRHPVQFTVTDEREPAEAVSQASVFFAL
ncbi:cytochrome c oxidase accessory protein CcoG [Shewanella sp. JM162201]|uniref:Cytochrome c oxidase accessory protein CcoG n=1 Tax=Shewanella jiangmenensis TaxID=2837387 RepID=A0ABS5UZL6_9GAMM|nr:cytochrome c oxidase accessory protein CcoG [Shewanella jiangmenensis]MBT1443647.1 cytochrome c oxidase accessory protein CcoG [Shewanella jiangmenensis]